jgi:hypothetical protein
MCTPVTLTVPYLLLGLQDIQWAVGNSRGARKLARTPHVNQKKTKTKNKKLEKYNFKIKYYLFHLKYKNILKIKLFIWLLTNMFINIKLVWFI